MDCQSAHCGVPAGGGATECLPQLSAVTCADGTMNNLETDIDCGGTDCVLLGKVCADGQQCTAASDCDGAAVCVMGVCVPLACYDGAHSVGESDTDCGGSCGACLDGMACDSTPDCTMGSECTAVASYGLICIDTDPLTLSQFQDSVDISAGDVLLHSILLDGSEPAGLSGTGIVCGVQVRLAIVGALEVSFPASTFAPVCPHCTSGAQVVARARCSSWHVCCCRTAACHRTMQLSMAGMRC